MKTPARLRPLLDDGLIQEVIRPLMQGKEASVYLVEADGDVCCAKVYREAQNRSFRQRADYQEGRKSRDSRRSRAMSKGSRYGRAELEQSWQQTEVDALYRLHAAGVRVPKPHLLVEGVLLMELIQDASGNPAPRMVDMELTPEEARAFHATLLRDCVRMLCVGLIHGDLSEYNVLVDPEGPVIIDLPQVIDAAANQSAKKLFLRDVNNLRDFMSQWAPELRQTQYGHEIWSLYERGVLHPSSELTGRSKRSSKKANVQGVLGEIDAARDEAARRDPSIQSSSRGKRARARPAASEEVGSGESAAPSSSGRTPGRRVWTPPEEKKAKKAGSGDSKRRSRRGRRKSSSSGGAAGERRASVDRPSSPKPRPEAQAQLAQREQGGSSAPEAGAPRRRRRRRRRRRGGGGRGGSGTSGSAS